MARITAWVLICAQLSACALAISGPGSNPNPAVAPACDTGRAGVFADGLGATLLGVGGIAAAGDGEGSVATGLLAGAGLLVLSARRGNRAASACEDAIKTHTTYLAEVEAQRESERVATEAARTARRPAAVVPVAPSPGAAVAMSVPPAPAPAPVPGTPPATLPSPRDAAAALTHPDPGPAPPASAEAEPPPSTDWSEFWELMP